MSEKIKFIADCDSLDESIISNASPRNVRLHKIVSVLRECKAFGERDAGIKGDPPDKYMKDNLTNMIAEAEPLLAEIVTDAESLKTEIEGLFWSVKSEIAKRKNVAK